MRLTLPEVTLKLARLPLLKVGASMKIKPLTWVPLLRTRSAPTSVDVVIVTELRETLNRPLTSLVAVVPSCELL